VGGLVEACCNLLQQLKALVLPPFLWRSSASVWWCCNLLQHHIVFPN